MTEPKNDPCLYSAKSTKSGRGLAHMIPDRPIPSIAPFSTTKGA